MSAAYTFKRFADVGRGLWIHREIERRDRWTREQLLSFQRRRLAPLVRHAVTRSPFYRDLYGAAAAAGDEVSLEDLPILTKTVLMENWDRLITDPRLRLDEVRNHVAGLTEDEYYLGRYRVLSTSGTTGIPGFFVFDRKEWSCTLANTLRWMSLIGSAPRLPRRLKMAAVGAPSPLHVTRRIAKSVDVGLYRKLDLEVTEPLFDLVAALNAFQPDTLITYPSVAALLAGEQLEERLRISPRTVCTGAELRTEEMEARIRAAWGVEPFNIYGITETGGLFACDCAYHRGLHVFEDMVIFEVVDEVGRPVPAGMTGHKLVVTNLFGYTQPLIRYELSDMVATFEEPCPCGRPLRLVYVEEGRSDDILYLRGRDGREIPVHPIHVRSPMVKLDGVKQYQIVHDEQGIHVSVVLNVGASHEETVAAVRRRLGESLESAGVAPPPISVRVIPCIEREGGQAAKFKLIKSVARTGTSSLTGGN